MEPGARGANWKGTVFDFSLDENGALSRVEVRIESRLDLDEEEEDHFNDLSDGGTQPAESKILSQVLSEPYGRRPRCWCKLLQTPSSSM